MIYDVGEIVLTEADSCWLNSGASMILRLCRWLNGSGDCRLIAQLWVGCGGILRATMWGLALSIATMATAEILGRREKNPVWGVQTVRAVVLRAVWTRSE
jgi:hypothetical protein